MNESFLDLLHREHEEVTYAINQISQVPAGDQNKLKDQWAEIKQKMIPHLIAEEKTLYAVLKGVPQAKDYAEKAHEQHRALESDIFEVNSLPLPDMNNWMQAFNRFKADAQMHFQFEESALFDTEQTYLERDQRQKMMDDYKKAKEDAKTTTIAGRYEGGFIV